MDANKLTMDLKMDLQQGLDNLCVVIRMTARKKGEEIRVKGKVFRKALILRSGDLLSILWMCSFERMFPT